MPTGAGTDGGGREVEGAGSVEAGAEVEAGVGAEEDGPQILEPVPCGSLEIRSWDRPGFNNSSLCMPN